MQQQTNNVPLFLSNEKILCFKQHQSTNVCVTIGCTRNAFICNSLDCQCQQHHNKRGCYMNNLDYVLNQIKSHKIEMDEQIDRIFQQIEKIYNQMIDKLSEERIKLLDSKQFFGLKQKCTEFVTLIRQGKQDEVTGNLCYEVRKEIDELNEKNQKKMAMINMSQVKRAEKFSSTQLDKAIKALARFRQDYNKPILFSKILSLEQSDQVYSYFTNPILSAELLYRGSQNDFKAQKFHKHCDGVPHTLVVAKTQFGKIIGGYTPIPWSSTDNSSNYLDTAQASFLFSVSLNEKYPLIKKKNAVLHQSHNGPIFGGGGGTDLMICDQCNTKKSSAGNFPYCYNNGNYTNGSSSYTAFSGSSSSIYFHITQYEVFKIEF